MTPASLPNHILELIRSGQAHNRADLARILHRAPSTISIHVNTLLANGSLIEEGETSSTGGRPGRRLISPNPQNYYLIADVGTQSIRYSMSDSNAQLLDIHALPLDSTSNVENQFATLTDALHSLIKDSPHAPHLRGICIGMPAPICPQNGYVHSSARIPQWNNFPVLDRLEKEFHLPACIENDVNLLALAEHIHHATHEDSITLKAGNGTGIGIILGDKIHRGATGAAGDISHVRHNSYGDAQCPCGNKGCLATVVSIAALTRIWKETGQGTTFDSLFEAAKKSNPQAIHILRQAGEQLGNALCTVVSFFNPGAVYLSGPLSDIDAYMSAIRTSIYGGCHPLITRNLMIAHSHFGQDGELRGAALLAKQRFSDPSNHRNL